MKIISKQKSIKLIGFLLALLASLTVLEAGVKFNQTYKYVGYERRDQFKWQTIAEQAQGQLSACNSDLETAKEEKATAIRAGNEDIMGEIK